MKTLAIISQKGGVGKTTLATALAVAAIADGKSAAIFDLDPQASASFWKDTREAATSSVVALPASRLQHVLKAASDEGCDLAIIDAPLAAKDVAFDAMQYAEFVLITTRHTVLDLMATTKTLELVRRYDKPAAVILTFCPTQGKEIGDTEAAVRQMGAELVPVRIHNRVAFARAQQTGLTAQEFEPDGRATDEIKRLYSYLCIHLCTSTRKAAHVRSRAS